MPSMKTIRRRIASVDTTKKIMKAMDMVAAAKLQKMKERLVPARSFANEARNILAAFDHWDEAMENAFCKQRPISATGYVVITSDRGLCGALNTALSEQALAHMNGGKHEKILAVGLKGHEYFTAREKNILRTYPDVSETVFYEDAMRIAATLCSLYTSGEVDEAYIAYTRYESALTHVPRIVRLLPVSAPTESHPPAAPVRCDPDVQVFLNHTIPMYLNAAVYTALIESSACEQAGRMMSMDSAVSNASDIIFNLTRAYNRKRQAAITQEISEIVGSANMAK